IWWNKDIPAKYLHYPYVPTIFELAKNRGYTTAMAVGKSKFVALAKPGTIDWIYLPKDYALSPVVANRAAEIIRAHQPGLLFLHFPDPDGAGHSSGWGSQRQIDAIEQADRSLALVLASLREVRIADRTAIILSADHGGAGTSHGAEDARSRHIPWI